MNKKALSILFVFVLLCSCLYIPTGIHAAERFGIDSEINDGLYSTGIEMDLAEEAEDRYTTWSDWSATPAYASSTRQVETRSIEYCNVVCYCCGNSQGYRCYLSSWPQAGYTLRLESKYTVKRSEINTWEQYAQGSWFGYATNVQGYIIGPGTAYIDAWNHTPAFITGSYYETEYRYRDLIPDTTHPTASLSSTNDVASSQKVTVEMNDNVGIKGYYWGRKSGYTGNEFFSTSKTKVTKTVSSPGTIYVTVLDTSNYISSLASITLYRTTLDANGGTVSPTSVLTKSGNSFTFPTPKRSGYTFIGWATDKNASKGVKSLKPTKNNTYYALWKKSLLATPKITDSKNTNSGMKITWGKIAGAAKYRVFRRNQGSKKWYKIGDTTKTSFTDKIVADMDAYYYTVRCISADGKTMTSSYDTKGKFCLYTATPKLISAVSGRAGVNVKWKMLSDRYYYVYRRTGTNSGWEKIAEVEPNTGGNYTDKKVKSGVKYSYTVRSKSQLGTSAYNEKGKAVTYIAPPILTKIINTKNGVSLTWGKVAGAAKYRVFRRVGTNGKWTVIKDTSGVTIVDKTSKKGVKYQYTLRCVTKDGKKYTSDFKTLGTITCKR